MFIFESMFNKRFVLFILFLLNLTSSTLADSSSVDFSQFSDINETSTSAPAEGDSSTEHCEDHDCCQADHMDLYLTSNERTNLLVSYCSSSFFMYVNFVPPCHLELIKPPIV